MYKLCSFRFISITTLHQFVQQNILRTSPTTSSSYDHHHQRKVNAVRVGKPSTKSPWLLHSWLTELMTPYTTSHPLAHTHTIIRRLIIIALNRMSSSPFHLQILAEASRLKRRQDVVLRVSDDAPRRGHTGGTLRWIAVHAVHGAARGVYPVPVRPGGSLRQDEGMPSC